MPRQARSRAAIGLAVALLLLLLYAAFAHGDVGLPTEARVQVAIDVLAALAAGAALWTGTLRLAAPRIALAGLALLGAFAIWSGATVLWSIAPSATWLEFNRAIAYVIVLALAITAGASLRRSVEFIAGGFFAVALVVTAYALGQKLVPELHASGLFNLNQTSTIPRLRAPLDYWNALALFVAFAVPIALAYAADSARGERSRLASLLTVELMMLTIGLTYSRGAVVALVVAVSVALGLGGARLRTLMLIGLAGVATTAPLIFGLANHSLTAAGVPLSTREGAGAELAALLVISLVVLCFAAQRLIGLESRFPADADRSRRIGRLLVGLLAVVLVGVVLALAVSSRGLGGSVSHAWRTFTRPQGTSLFDPKQLVSVDSGNRWVWWEEALGAFSDHPVGGWGAGSFPVLHLLYRRNTLPVQQPHSVPLEFLAETGVVGAVLGLGAFALLLVAAVGTVRRREPGSGRMLAAALAGAGAAYAFHALYDWDWDFPSVTLPALVFLGVLAGARRRAFAARRGHTVVSLPGPGAGARSLALAGVAAVLSLLALSAVVPSLAQTKAHSALVAASSQSPQTLSNALATADLATRLDPLSDAGLTAAATIAQHRGQLTIARRDLLDAVRRVPTDSQAWLQLADLELELGDARNLSRAADRALALDPYGTLAPALVRDADLLTTPPSLSASASATPLTGG